MVHSIFRGVPHLMPRPRPLDARRPELSEHEVDWDSLRESDVDDLARVLENATDERPLQVFLRDHPYLLAVGVLGLIRDSWVISQPRFGAEYVPDFLLGLLDSLGAGWTLVELESPTMNPIRSDGLLSAGLHQAVQQVRDWRRWLERNASYLEYERGFAGISAGAAGVVVVGRREYRADTLGAERLRDYRAERIEVMSYDRILEHCRSQVQWVATHRGQGNQDTS